MPIYEYRCAECQQLFEEWCKHVKEHSMPHTCPICKGQAHRIVSNTSFALKGGGWYVTEYGSRREKGSSCGDASCKAEAPSEAPKTCAASGACAGASGKAAVPTV